MMPYRVIMLGGILGTLLRWLVGLLLPVVANATGCLVIGLFACLTDPVHGMRVGPRLRLFVMTGICGGYTTFSGFGLDTLGLLQGEPRQAAVYVGASLASWLAAVWIGDAFGRPLRALWKKARVR
jgi:fluoride exporter